MNTTPTTTSGYFSGDWEISDAESLTYDVAYAAVSYGPTWNGFCAPVVTREVMEAFVARQNEMLAGGDTVDPMRWDGDAVVVGFSDAPDPHNPDPEDEVRLAPNADGNYDLGLLGWTFECLDDSDIVTRKVG